jgi:hypothetical protein
MTRFARTRSAAARRAGACVVALFTSAWASAQGGTPEGPCPADLNGDALVDSLDLGLVLGAWQTSGPGDIDADGVVSPADLALLLGDWGPCPLSLDGLLYEILLEGTPITVGTSTGPQVTSADVRLQFTLGAADDEGIRLVDVEAATVLAVSVDTEAGKSGNIGFTLRPDPPPGYWNTLTGEFYVPLNFDGYYGLIDDVVPPDWTGPSDEVGPPNGPPPEPITEIWTGHLAGSAASEGDTLTISASASGRPTTPKTPYITTTTIPIELQVVPKDFGLDECPSAMRCQTLTLCVQPVIFDFTGSPAGGSSGTTLAAMKAEADAIFAKACVEIEWLAPIVIQDQQGKYRDIEDVNAPVDLTDAAQLVDPKGENQCIEVFFHKRFMTPDGTEHRWGDGTTVRSGTPQAKIFLADAAAEGDCGDTRLLAHELGHAIGQLGHSDETFMEATGDPPNCPGQPPSKVSQSQLAKMRASSLLKVKMPKAPCCMTPDA